MQWIKFAPNKECVYVCEYVGYGDESELNSIRTEFNSEDFRIEED